MIFHGPQPGLISSQNKHLFGGIDLGDVGQEVEDTAGVAPLVVVPGDQLDEVVVEGDTGLDIEDGGVGVAEHVAGDDIVVGVGQNALEGTIGSLLDGLSDGSVAGGLLEADSQVDNRDVGGGDTDGHAGELAVEGGDDLADGLGGTSAAGDHVLGSTTATTPVLSGGTIDGLLGGSVGVDSGHETLNDAVVVVDDLGEGSQAVGGARGVGDDIGRAVVLVLVDTHHVHGGIGRGGRDDDFLGTAGQVSLGLVGGGEDTGGLDNVVGASLAPLDVGRVTLGVEADLLAVHNEVLAIDIDVALEDTVGGIILEHVGSIGGLDEGVVDGDDLDVGVLNSVAEDDTSNSAEAVDAVDEAARRTARDRAQSTSASFASFTKRSWIPSSRSLPKIQSDAPAPAATSVKQEAKSNRYQLKRAVTASIQEITTNQTTQTRLVDSGAKPATKGFARATSYFSRIKQKPASTLSKTSDSIGSDFSCASSATSLAQPGSSSIDTHVSQSASSAETNSTTLTTDESSSEMPARMPDPLWSQFKNLDLEFRGFASKAVAQQCALIQSLFLPFLKSTTSQQSLSGLRPEDVDCRASILNKWWGGVLDMLEVQHQQPVPGLDRQLLFETATTIMMRLEWRQTTSYFMPLSERSPQDRTRARSSTNSSNSSQSSNQSAMLAESAEHNIRTMFVSNLVRQMAFVVEKMSLRHVPPSLIEFAGKTCAYAFFFAPGVSDILVRLWGLTPDLIRRVSESMGLGRNSSSSPVDEEITASFPPRLSSLAWSSPRGMWATLKRIPKMPLLVARVPWTGPWVMRWKGRDTDLLFIFCRHFHILSDQFMPEGLSLTEKAHSPAFVLVHAQLLSILDGTIHRQATFEPQGSLLANSARGAEAAALQMPMPPNNMMKSMSENRLVVLLKDILSDSASLYPGARHTFAEAFSALLKAAASRTSRYNSTACSTLCDLLEEVILIYHRAETAENPTCYIDWPFWVEVCKLALTSLNTLSEIRMISFIFTIWDAITKDPEQKMMVCRDWLLTEETFNAFFNNWCPMVRAYYMRLLCWRICRDKGSQNDTDMEIFALVSKRLKSVWSHYLYLQQAAEEAGQPGPATEPMSPTLGKRFIIIRQEISVPQPGLFVTFDTFTKASSIVSPTSDKSADASLLAKNDPKKKWSILKLLTFTSTASPDTKTTTDSPSKDDGLQNARREVANSRARQNASASPPRTAKSDKSVDSDGSNPVFEEPKFTFKFVLGWPQPNQQPSPIDRILARPRLPTPAQARLGFQPKRGGGPTLPPLMIPTRKFSGSSQGGLVQAARNASPLSSPVTEPHRKLSLSGGVIPEEFSSTSGSETNSGASTPSESRFLPSPIVHLTPSEERQGDAKPEAVKPAGVFVKNLVYSGRALSEWSLVIAECNNFVERRRDEGIGSLSEVEVPLLGVEGFRKMGG